MSAWMVVCPLAAVQAPLAQTSAGRDPAATAAPPMLRITIDAPTVGSIGQWSLGVANVMLREGPDDAGRVHPGPSASLSIWRDGAGEQRTLIVSRGMHIDLGASGRWEITEVALRPPGERDPSMVGGYAGHITLERR